MAAIKKQDKILIAEDEPATRELLETMLQDEWGYDVQSVGDGVAVLKLLKESTVPHLVILDWMMPGKSGVEVCKEIRRMDNLPQPYIIILSGKSHYQDIKEGLDSGADDYIQKPFNFDELKARVNVGMRVLRLQSSQVEKERLRGVLEMAGTICHEINQPLMSITGLSELLLMDAAGNKDTIDDIRIIKEQAERLGEITSKLMKITRYETRKYLKRDIIDLDKATDEQRKDEMER